MSMMPITAALVLSTKSLWEQAHSCIQNLPVRIALEQTEATETDALLDRLDRHRVDVVLIEAGRLTLPLEEFVRRLKNSATQPLVFVLHTAASPQLILEALRAGAAEFLYTPLQDTLRDAFERLSANRAATAAGVSGALGKIYGFISAKGGCGATTIACHVASEIARTLNQPSLLADLDFEAGLVRFILKTKTTYSVRDAIDNLHRMDSSYWKALVSSHPHQLDIIPSPDDIALKHLPTAEEIVHLLRFIRSTYPAAVVDFGRCMSAAALDSIHEVDAMFVVTTLDLTTLEHTRRALNAMDENASGSSRVKVLLNKVAERGAPDLKNFEQLLGRVPSACFINDFSSLYDAYSEGHLVEPGTRLGKEMKAFSASLVRRIRGGETDRDMNRVDFTRAKSQKNEPAATKKWFSFLQRSSSQKSERSDLAGTDSAS